MTNLTRRCKHVSLFNLVIELQKKSSVDTQELDIQIKFLLLNNYYFKYENQ